jgi:hypothetical protein
MFKLTAQKSSQKAREENVKNCFSSLTSGKSKAKQKAWAV